MVAIQDGHTVQLSKLLKSTVLLARHLFYHTTANTTMQGQLDRMVYLPKYIKALSR